MYYKFPTALVNLSRAGKEFCTQFFASRAAGAGGKCYWQTGWWAWLDWPRGPAYVCQQPRHSTWHINTSTQYSHQYSTATSQPRYASITSHPIKQRVYYLHARMEWHQQLHIDSDTLYVVTVSDNIWHMSTAALNNSITTAQSSSAHDTTWA